MSFGLQPNVRPLYQRAIWCPSPDSNRENLVFETNTFASYVRRALEHQTGLEPVFKPLCRRLAGHSPTDAFKLFYLAVLKSTGLVLPLKFRGWSPHKRGPTREATIPMIAITINSSMRVKPFELSFFMVIPLNLVGPGRLELPVAWSQTKCHCR